MQIKVEVSDELAMRLSPLQEQLTQILELGLREWSADAQSGFSGLADVLEFLANLPTPEEILALKPSEALQQHIISDRFSRTRTSTSSSKLDKETRFLEETGFLYKGKITSCLNFILL